jgi:proteasome lid subunit RPN8/RPN11
LSIPENIVADLRAAARAHAPLETCGLLAGAEQRVTKFYPLTNADASPEHFSMLPAEQFAAIKDMRKNGTRMLAIWHSHPASPARMSVEDLRLALTPDVAYVITSLAVPEAVALRAFVVRDGTPDEIELTIIKSTGA